MKKQNLNSILLMYINYIINYFNNIHKNQLKKYYNRLNINIK